MPERFFVIGCGSIGQRHVRNLRSLGARDIAAFDPDPARIERVVREQSIVAKPDVEAGLADRPDAILVCTPPHLHTSIARQAIEAGAHVFLEKPIAPTLDGVDDLLQAAQQGQRVLMVAYNLRFHTGLRKLKELLDGGAIGQAMVIQAEFGQYLPDWRPAQDYRTGYNVSAAMGGGIIFDASHEIDYVRWLGGEAASVYCIADHLSRLEMDTEDTAAITLRMTNNVLAEIHLDCVQRGYTRQCKVIGTDGTLIWKFKEGVTQVLTDKSSHVYAIAPDANDMYIAEMQHFLACVRGKETPRVTGVDGKRVLEIALAAKHSAQTRCEVAV